MTEGDGCSVSLPLTRHSTRVPPALIGDDTAFICFVYFVLEARQRRPPRRGLRRPSPGRNADGTSFCQGVGRREVSVRVTELRKVAGSAMREAWSAEPITDDAAMNIPPSVIDLSSLPPLAAAFTTAVRDHLAAIAPWWAR